MFLNDYIEELMTQITKLEEERAALLKVIEEMQKTWRPPMICTCIKCEEKRGHDITHHWQNVCTEEEEDDDN